MTHSERQQQAQDAIALCERIGHRLKRMGAIAELTDARLQQAFTGEDLTAAIWLRDVVKRKGRD